MSNITLHPLWLTAMPIYEHAIGVCTLLLSSLAFYLMATKTPKIAQPFTRYLMLLQRGNTIIFRIVVFIIYSIPCAADLLRYRYVEDGSLYVKKNFPSLYYLFENQAYPSYSYDPTNCPTLRLLFLLSSLFNIWLATTIVAYFVNSLSDKTRRLQQKAMVLLIVQTIPPLAILMAPLLIYSASYIFVKSNPNNSNVLICIQLTHSFVYTSILIISTPSYREPFMFTDDKRAGTTTKMYQNAIIFHLLLSSLFVFDDAYKILVYNSKFGHSHSTFLGQITDILADNGHNVVTSLLPIINPAIADGTEKSLKIHVQPDPVINDFYEKQQQVNFFGIDMFNPIVPFVVGSMFANDFGRTCKKVIEKPGLIGRLRAEKYDVMITEQFDICGIGISHAIAPKTVISSSSTFLFGWQLEEFGVESAASSTQTSTCSEPLIESAAPTTARIVNVPGIGAKAPKPLDQYWEVVLTRRERTVLLSFGSVALSTQLPEKSKRGILRAIARFPETTFIWKYENLEDAFAKETSTVANLVLTKWMPQADLLNHKNLALFFTHGGMGSTRETALRGVPGLFIPVFFDQARNAGMAEFNGLGRVYDKFELHDDQKLAELIKEMLENRKYRKNAKRLSKMLDKKPFTSKELLLRHVEFAAEFGASAALRPQSVDMSLVEYHNLDLIGLFLIFAALSIYVISKVVVSTFSLFF